MPTANRKTVLLKACYDMLKKCNESPYVLEVMNETVCYDGAACDGYCLLGDIACELGISEEEYK